MNLRLTYKGKKNEKAVIESVIGLSLSKISSHGNFTLDGWSNLLIHSDNLVAMKTLLSMPDISQKIRLVYIDPPFSTNNVFKAGSTRTSTISSSKSDDLAYTDKLIGAEFIDFLRNRLIFLKRLMAKSGSIYLHIDWKMGHYVKAIMDEVFGQKRFLNDITRIKCNPKNFDRKSFGNIKDMILLYSLSGQYVWNAPRQKMSDDDIKRLFAKIDVDGRRYTTTPLHAPGETINGATGKPWRGMKPPKGRHWRVSPDELEGLDTAGLIEWSSTGNPRKKIFADENGSKGKRLQDIWEFKDPPYPKYPTEKNIEMLKTIIQASSNPGDIVLDCFAGSGATLLAAELLGRRWIGIDNSKIAIDVSIKRLIQTKRLNEFTLYKVKKSKKVAENESMDK